MKRYFLLGSLLLWTAFSLYAQEWTKKDSLRLEQLLQTEGEIKLNLDAVKDLNKMFGKPEIMETKPWLEVDETLPAVDDIKPRKVKITLFPYTANTPYNWDPVHQRKIRIDKNTWRNDRFYELKKLRIYSNWAQSPLDPGPRESVEQIETTGLQYSPVGYAGGQTVFMWQSVGKPSGYSLMPDKDFWNRKGRKRRLRTLEVLRTYADSTRIEPKDSLKRHPLIH